MGESVSTHSDVLQMMIPNDEPIDSSVAARMLMMGRIEGLDSEEKKERFQQRLWSYLFENLNKAIDELYYLCELECDTRKIEKACFLLNEASLDFKDLKSKIERFEKEEKACSTATTSAMEEDSGKSSSAGGGGAEQQRPHAVAWEVHRMGYSPHQAETVSSSLEDSFGDVPSMGRNNIHRNSNKSYSKGKLMPTMVSALENLSKEAQTPQIDSFRSHDYSIKSSDGMVADEMQIGNSFRSNGYASENPTKSLGASSLAYSVTQSSNNMATIHVKDSLRSSVGGVVDTCPKHSETSGSTCGFMFVGGVSFQMPMDLEEENTTLLLPINGTATQGEKHNKGMESTSERHVLVLGAEKSKKFVQTKKFLDAWKEMKNGDKIGASPRRSSPRNIKSPKSQVKSSKRARVVNEKQSLPLQRMKKSALESQKVAMDEKQSQVRRVRRDIKSEQQGPAKLPCLSTAWKNTQNRKVKEWIQNGQNGQNVGDAEKNCKLSEGMHKDTPKNGDNKELLLLQKLRDSEARRSERLETIKTKKREYIAREVSVLERKRLLEAQRLQRISQTQKKKEVAKAKREEELKAATAVREARALDQIRKKKLWEKAQQEEAEMLKRKLSAKLKESEIRRNVYLKQIRERAMVDSREHASPSNQHPLRSDTQDTCQPNIVDTGGSLQYSDSILWVKELQQKLIDAKHEFAESLTGLESDKTGSMLASSGSRLKIRRWLQDLQRVQHAKKAESSGVGGIISDIIKYMNGKEVELHVARQEGLLDFIATALLNSYTPKLDVSPKTISLLRVLCILLSLPTNRSYFIGRNLLPPFIPMLCAALELYCSLGSINSSYRKNGIIGGFGSAEESSGENCVELEEVLNGLLKCFAAVFCHNCNDPKKMKMKDDLLELLVASGLIHRLRDLFSLFDRPHDQGFSFTLPVLLGLNLLQILTEMGEKGYSIVWDQINLELALPRSGSINKLNSADPRNADQELDCQVLEISDDSLDSTKPRKCEMQQIQRRKWVLNQSLRHLVTTISKTGLAGILSLLTAVLLQPDRRLSMEQFASTLPSNFEEVAIRALKILNNVARMDLDLVQKSMATPDLQIEFFHIASFLLSYCTFKWKGVSDEVGFLLLETLLLLGYFALLHPENQAVFHRGKSPTILQKIYDLPNTFFSEPQLIPVLTGTLLAVCYGNARNRDLVCHELGMETVLSIVKYSKELMDSQAETSAFESSEPNWIRRYSSHEEPQVKSKNNTLSGVKCVQSSSSRTKKRTGSITKCSDNGISNSDEAKDSCNSSRDQDATRATNLGVISPNNPDIDVSLPPEFMLRNRFPPRLLDSAEGFFCTAR